MADREADGMTGDPMAEGVKRLSISPSGNVLERPETGAFMRVSDLALVYEHFCDRLLGETAERAFAEACGSDLTAAGFVRGMNAALQATSIPEGCNCSYDRLVTQEQAFAIRAACPVHGATPQNEEGR